MPGLLASLSRFTRGTTRMPLISKRGNKNFYKGRGAPSPGVHLRKGNFGVVPAKLEAITFKVPDLTGFELKPYVQNTTPKVPLDVVDPLIPRIAPDGAYISPELQTKLRSKRARKQFKKERTELLLNKQSAQAQADAAEAPVS